MDTFDLLEYQQKARELLCPKKLFFLFEDVCRLYERGEIGEYEYEEMKAVIWPALKTLSSLRRIIDSMDQPRKKRLRRRA
jgi:hypothetical protein